MQTKLFSIFCMSLLLISNVKSSYSYRDNNDFVFFDLSGKPTLIKPDNGLFNLDVNDKDVYLSMIVPGTGYLLAKKEGNHKLTEYEKRDLIRYVEAGQNIPMGMETLDDPDSVPTALDLINSVEDSDRLAHEFIQMTEFTHKDISILDVRSQYFSNKSFHDATVAAKYGGNSNVISDADDALASTIFDPKNPGDASGVLVSIVSDYFIKPTYRRAFSKYVMRSYRTDDLIRKYIFIKNIRFDSYSLQLDRDSFMTAFNSAVNGQSEVNLLLKSVQLEYLYELQSLKLPIAVGEDNTQEAEDSRMKFTKEFLFYYLFELVADKIGTNMDNKNQEKMNKESLLELAEFIKHEYCKPNCYDEINKFSRENHTIDHGTLILKEFLHKKFTANKVEVMFWMIQFKDQIYDYIQYYLEQLADNPDFVNIFINDNALDYSKLQKVLKYFSGNDYERFYLFVKNRRNLVLV